MKKKAFESVLMRWINMEPVIKSEVRKRKNSILMCIRTHRYIYIYGI